MTVCGGRKTGPIARETTNSAATTAAIAAIKATSFRRARGAMRGSPVWIDPRPVTVGVPGFDPALRRGTQGVNEDRIPGNCMSSAVRKTVAAMIGAAAVGWTGGASAQGARHIVSLNVCAAQLLLALADPEQIGALSLYAADPGLSFLAIDAARFRHDTSSAEQVVAAKPDMVLAGTLTKRAT